MIFNRLPKHTLKTHDKNYLYWLVNSKTHQENIKLVPSKKVIPYSLPAFIIDEIEIANNNMDFGIYKYKISFYSTVTKEESISSEFLEKTVNNNYQITISQFSPIFDRTFNSWKIYRTKKNGDIFYYISILKESENNIYIDNKNDNELIEEQPELKLRITQPINTHLINKFTRQLILKDEYPDWESLFIDKGEFKLEPGVYKYTVTFFSDITEEEEETEIGSETTINLEPLQTFFSNKGRIKIQIPISNNPNVTHVKIYRTPKNGNTFYLLEKIPVNEIVNNPEYIDNKLDDKLGASIPETNNRINTYYILKLLNTEVAPNLHSFISHSTDLTFANQKSIFDLNDYFFNKPFIMLINNKGTDTFNNLLDLKQSFQTTNAYFYNIPFKVDSSSKISLDKTNSIYLMPLSTQQFFNKANSKYYSIDLKNQIIVEALDNQIIQKTFNPSFDEFNISNTFLNTNNYSYILIDQIIGKINEVITANPEYKLLIDLIESINDEFVNMINIFNKNNLFGSTTKKILSNLKDINKISNAFTDKMYNIDLLSYLNLDYLKYSHYALELLKTNNKDINNIKLNIYDSDVNLSNIKVISPVYKYYNVTNKISQNLEEYLKNVSSFFKNHIEYVNQNLDYLNISDPNNYQEQFLSTNEITQHKYDNFYEYNENTNNQIKLLHPITERNTELNLQNISKINIKTSNVTTLENFKIIDNKTIITSDFKENILEDNFNDANFMFENRNEMKSDKFNYLGLCHIDTKSEINLDDKYIGSKDTKLFELDDNKIYVGTADNTLGRYHLGKNSMENKLLVSSLYCSNPYELKFGDSNKFLEFEKTEGYYYKLKIKWDTYKEITFNEDDTLPAASQNQYKYFINLSDNLLYYSDGTEWILNPEIVNAKITSSNNSNYLNRVVLIRNNGYFQWGIQSNINIECLFYINNVYHEGILENLNDISAILHLKTKYVIDIDFNELFYSNNLKSQLIKNITVEEFKKFNFEKKFDDIFNFDYFKFGNKYYTSSEIIKVSVPEFTFKTNPVYNDEILDTETQSFLFNKIFMYISNNDLNNFIEIIADNGTFNVTPEEKKFILFEDKCKEHPKVAILITLVTKRN